MTTGLTPSLSRTDLAEAALSAATELEAMIQSRDDAEMSRITHFRDVLRCSTEGWNDSQGKTGRLTDALTARLYFDALQSTGNKTTSLDEFLAEVSSVITTFDSIASKQYDIDKLRDMRKFALALHTLIIGDAYGRISHWKHQGLL